MGMYTGLRVDAIIKPEYREIIDKLHNADLDNRWGDLSEEYPQYDWLRNWSEVGRSSFIPFGAVCYMPDSWGDGYSRFDIETGRWQFTCSLKNYESEIQTFLTTVYLEIVESHDLCEYLYEESEHPTFLRLEDIKLWNTN